MTFVMSCYITYVMSCHVMLYNICHVMLCYITCVMSCYAPINVNPVGGGSADKGWGYEKFYNFLIKFPRVGKKRSIKSVKKAPTPGGKI